MKRLIAIVLLVMLFARVVNAQDQVETARVQSMYEYIILFLGAVVAAVLFVAFRLAINLRDALPPQITPFLPILLNVLVELAKKTQTGLDDELVQKLKDLFGETPANDGGVG